MTPRKGRYYFLPDDAAFIDHSLLGGWWWEGRDQFQSGQLATLPEPDPKWVNGSIPTGPNYAEVKCCAGLFPPFIPTLAIFKATRISDGAYFEHPADVVALGHDPTSYTARLHTGHFPDDTVIFTCLPNARPSLQSHCSALGYLGEFRHDDANTDPLYRISNDFQSVAFHFPPAFPLDCALVHLVVDWYGPELPGPEVLLL